MMGRVLVKGMHRKGHGKASSCCNVHTKIFGTKMIGTFNIDVPGMRIHRYHPSITLPEKDYWFLHLMKDGLECYGWAVRDKGSRQRVNTFEVITKKRIPENFEKGIISIEILEPWTSNEIATWSDKIYWFQTFPFSAKKRADSMRLWDDINIIHWSGLEVLDIGCHYGYFSLKASREGAIVHGEDINSESLRQANIIRDFVWQHDVTYSKPREYADKSFDVILYLSVHHQIDPTYQKLEEKMQWLRKVARKHVFVELIMPPMFPEGNTYTEEQIDKIIGGDIVNRYKHEVRGSRKVYYIDVSPPRAG